MLGRRAVGRMAVAAGLGLGLSTLWMSPASAHQLRLTHGSDVGFVGPDHSNAQIHDLECDGVYVRLEYDVSTIGGTVRYSLIDPNGCNSGWGNRNHYPQRILRARMCEGSSCTPWRSVT